ncbi:DUF1801 domain-containing protein [Labrenzia sp. VG12]|uniref:DUF1801 domain-containing protein n=1 Tax=Labrenzia sp. VG12 TaxID=2021862 RepID=UPI000B8C6661|nr:DUF1801 domain-containing protein [Labrenzia sp. VG12]ASP32815.1 hypothetical protein CHH27_05770 [Labrenzia sp. VG12]
MQDDPSVMSLLDGYPEDIKAALLQMRSLILRTAAENKDIGVLEETLKWSQPSYLTTRPKTGTTIRIDRDKSDAGDFALYVNCQSSLVSEWRALFPQFTYGGDRSVHFQLGDPLPENELRQMITMALTYHQKKRSAGKN